MPSPADQRRVWGERAARGVAVGALLLAWWQAGRPAAPEPGSGSASGAVTVAVTDDDASELATLLAQPNGRWLELRLRRVPSLAARALLQAGAEAGVPVYWSADSATGPLPPLAISAVALADPQGGTAVRVATRPAGGAANTSVTGRADSAASARSETPGGGSLLSLRDSLGVIDSARPLAGGVAWTLDGDPRPLVAVHRDTRAMVPPATVPRLGRLRMYAAPGWDARFAVEALEELGWSVDAEFAVAPRVRRTAGRPQSLDTSTYAAVIALDSTAWPEAGAVARFVQTGGGLVLFPDAARGAGYRGLRVAQVGALQPGIPGGLRTANPRTGLTLHPLIALRPSAVVLERSSRVGEPPAVAAWRVGSGRVVQSGWSDTWEWRMLGGDDSPAAHRDWWRRLVQRAAYVSIGGEGMDAAGAPGGTRGLPARTPGDAAPLADLVARVGTARVMGAAPVRTGSTEPAAPPAWLFVVAALALVGEWWSRRLRGAR